MENTTSFFTGKTTIKIDKRITVQEEKEIDIIDWSKVPNGTYMTANINGEFCKGVLSREGNLLYFCQNRHSGSDCNNKFGFKYSWCFHQHSDFTHSDNVEDIQFPPKPDDLVIPEYVKPADPVIVELNSTYNAIIHPDFVEVGCQRFTKEKIAELFKAMEEFSK